LFWNFWELPGQQSIDRFCTMRYMWIMQVLMMSKKIHLIMIVIIKTEENVNVWIHGFDDAKVESNEVASTNIQRLSIILRLMQGCFKKHSKVKHCLKINSRSSKQDQEKDKASNNLIGWSSFCLKTHCFQHPRIW